MHDPDQPAVEGGGRPGTAPARWRVVGAALAAVVIAIAGFFASDVLFGAASSNGGRGPGSKPSYQLPDVIRNGKRDIREAYQFALERPDVLDWMDCPCGCVNEGHRNNRMCFIQNVADDGSITLDPHGMT